MSEDQLDTETHKATTQTWKVAEESPVTVLETVNFPDGTSILRLPDKDGKPIYFPSYRISVERPDDLLPGKRHEVLKDIGRSDVVIRGNLSKEQLERLDYALDDLKLPTILAVHAALNTDLDLKSYQKPNKDVPIPVTLAMLGRPGVGKSFMSGLLSYREGYSIINLDSSSGFSSERYREYFEKNAKGKDLSVEKAWGLANEVRSKEESHKPKVVNTLRNMLDIELRQLLGNPERYSLYLVDMPGMPGTYNFGTGRSHGKERKFDLLDLVARESCESGVISSHQLTMEPVFEGVEPHMERKLRWIKDEVVGKNMAIWREMRQDFVDAVKQRSS